MVSPFPCLFASISSTHLVIRLYIFWNKYGGLCLCSTSQDGHGTIISAGKAGGDLGNGKRGQPGSGTVTPLSIPGEPLKTLLSSKELGFCNALQAVSAKALSWPAQGWGNAEQQRKGLEQLIPYSQPSKKATKVMTPPTGLVTHLLSQNVLSFLVCPSLIVPLQKKRQKNYWSVKQGQSHLFKGRICK